MSNESPNLLSSNKIIKSSSELYSERERERERERGRERKRDRQTDRQTDRQREREMLLMLLIDLAGISLEMKFLFEKDSNLSLLLNV